MGSASDREGPSPPPLELSESEVVALAEELVAYHGEFADLFFRREQQHWGLVYTEGLLHPDFRKSVEPLALSVEGGKVRAMQRFIGEGAWEDEPILRKHRELVAESVGAPDGILIVDGTDFPKKGKHSVGVARQYCGATGKVDNCQASVFLAYASSQGHTLLDRRLYLPEEWFAEAWRERWERCGIPDDVVFRTKPRLAWGMIQAAVESGVLPLAWVTCDEAFGNNPEFLGHLERAELRYLAEVPVSTLVWRQRPDTEVAAAKATGRPPSRRRVVAETPPPLRVDQLAAQLPLSAWRKRRVKDGEKGPIEAQFARQRVVAVRDKLPGPELWVLFRRSLSQPPELKVYLSNAAPDVPLGEVVRVSGMRWPIETCFEEAKGSLGMAEYQIRSWRGWHHHMTLVILAHHFLVRLRLKHKRGHRRSPTPRLVSCSPPSSRVERSRPGRPLRPSATSNATTTRPSSRTTATMTDVEVVRDQTSL
jgi:SRSO17 transposase